jgi:hypothetical protein
VSVSSTVLLEPGPLIITFYRGIWCPYCRSDLMALMNATFEVQSRGGSLAASAPRRGKGCRPPHRGSVAGTQSGSPGRRSWWPLERLMFVICSKLASPAPPPRIAPLDAEG